MLQPEYTEKERKLFTGRTSTINQIQDSLNKHNKAVVLAPSGFGRNSLLKHIAAENNYFYLDLRKFSITPENFAVELMGTICFLELAKDPSTLLQYQTIDKLKELKLGKKSNDLIKIVDNELQKIKPDQELILNSAFAFGDEFAGEQKKKHMIVLNNFDELLKLNNFSQVKDVLSIFFNKTSKDKNCSFILSSSSVQVMKSLLKKHITDMIEVPALSATETERLFEKLVGKTDARITTEIHGLSAGLPLIINSIAKRFREEKTGNTQKDIKLIRYILSSELTTKDSLSYFYCSKLFADSLNRARGEALLKAILKAVSQNRPLRLTEISKLIYRSGPVTKSLLERLIEVDLVVKTDNTFNFANPVLKQWCRLMFSGVEFNEIPDEDTLSKKGGLL